MQETTLNGESLDLVAENIQNLKELFPEIVTEDKIDFDKLKQILGNYTEDDSERYNFTWKGKSASLRRAQTPSMLTLRPCKDESKNWDNTKNLYIEGDNLDVLKLLQKSYHKKIKMIYIDPPYNTGNEFVYSDDFKDNLQYYRQITGQVDSEGVKTSTNTESSGRYHTNWLNMMYPRLRLARNLLSDDGAIFISIDDNELENLKKICNEIFGEENFRNMILVRRYDKNINRQFFDKGLVSLNTGVEYVLIYGKSPEFKMNPLFREASEERKKNGYWKGFWNNADRPTMRYDILGVTPDTGQWKWKKEVAYEAVKNYEIFLEDFSDKMSLEDYWETTGKNKKFIRRNLNGKGVNRGVEHWIPPAEGILRNTLWQDIFASKGLKNLEIFFDNPKNPEMIENFLKMATDEKSIVLDFFSGSATTAHAVMDLNSKDGGNRRFIMVQIPELTSEKDESYKAGYKNISEIGKERIRRAGDKIVLDINNSEITLDNQPDKLDIGFKVFKMDSSNISKWDPQYDNLEQTLLNSVENLVPNRSETDLIYEIMLKYGIDLTLPIEESQIKNDEKIYSIGFGALIICLSENITSEIATEIVKLKDKLSPEIMRVVFKDNGFATDSDKTNVKETLNTHGIDEFVTI